MKSTFLIFSFLLFTLLIKSQNTFQRSYGGINDEINEYSFKNVHAIEENNENGYGFCYSTFSYGQPYNSQVYFLSTDTYGNLVNAKTYYRTDTTHCYGRSIFKTPDGGYILGVGYLGTKNGLGLIRIKANGDTIWSKRFDANNTPNNFDAIGAYGMRLSNGSFIAAGYIQVGYQSATLVRVDSLGNQIFGKRYCTPVTETSILSTLELKDGNLLSVGFYKEQQNITEILLLKTDQIGNIIWAKSYFNPNYAFYGINAVELENRSIIVGCTSDPCSNIENSCLLRIDSLGTVQFSTLYTDSLNSANCVNAICKDKNEDIYLTGLKYGKYDSILGQQYFSYVSKNNNYNGNSHKSKIYKYSYYGASILNVNQSNILTIGSTDKFGSGGYDLFITKDDTLLTDNCNTENVNFIKTDIPMSVKNLSLNVISDVFSKNISLNIFSGTSTVPLCSNAVNLVETSNHGRANLILFPNPTKDNFTVKADVAINSLIVTDVLGKTIKDITASGKSEITINSSDLLNGIYFVTIKTSKGTITKKVIKD